MKPYRSSLFSFVACLLLGLPALLSAAESVGKVAAVVGSVDVFRAGSEGGRPLAFGDPLFLDDRIRTGIASKAKILLRDDSILKVGPTSALVLTEQVIGADESRRTTIQLLEGRLRSVIGKTLKPDSYYRVETPVAVAGVRGTDFEVLMLSPEQTAVRSFEGTVEVRNSLERVAGRVLVEANTFSLVRRGMAPTLPVPIAPGESLESRLGGSSGRKGSEAPPAQDVTGELEMEEAAQVALPDLNLLQGLDPLPMISASLDEDRGTAYRDLTDRSVETVMEEIIDDDLDPQSDPQGDLLDEPAAAGVLLGINVEIPTL